MLLKQMLILGYSIIGVMGSMSFTNIEKFQFVDPLNPILESKSREVNLEDLKEPAMQKFLDRMLAFAKGEQIDQQKSVLVGLSAPQIGYDVRIILVDVKADGKGKVSELAVYINPEIISSSKEVDSWYEGCYSTGNIKGIVSRPREITIKAFNRLGEEIYETHKDYVARIFQHEIDHLNGIRFPDRVTDHGFLHIVKDKDMQKYRNEGAWRDWKDIIPREDWLDHLKG